MRKTSLPHRTQCAVSLLLTGLLTAGIAAIAAADVPQDLEDALNGLQGNEISGAFPVDVSGVHIDVTLLGFAFCTPPDPDAPPAGTATPPLNVYGCQNAATVEVTTTQADTVTFSMAVPQLFLDLHTARERTILCGEFGTGTRAADGYVLCDVTAQARVATQMIEGCTIYTLVPNSVDLSVGSFSLHSADGCLETFAAAADVLVQLLEPQLQSQVEIALAAALRQRNHDVCGLVADRASSWGTLKASY